MAAPAGNINAARGTRWKDALNKALARFTSKEPPVAAGEALDAIAFKVVESALHGDWEAITEIGNRLDGKAAQGVSVTGADGGPIAMIWPLAKSTLDQP
jgi:hypothetical protein